MPVLLVWGEGDMFRPEHMVELCSSAAVSAMQAGGASTCRADIVRRRP